MAKKKRFRVLQGPEGGVVMVANGEALELMIRLIEVGVAASPVATRASGRNEKYAANALLRSLRAPTPYDRVFFETLCDDPEGRPC